MTSRDSDECDADAQELVMRDALLVSYLGRMRGWEATEVRDAAGTREQESEKLK